MNVIVDGYCAHTLLQTVGEIGEGEGEVSEQGGQCQLARKHIARPN